MNIFIIRNIALLIFTIQICRSYIWFLIGLIVFTAARAMNGWITIFEAILVSMAAHIILSIIIAAIYHVVGLMNNAKKTIYLRCNTLNELNSYYSNIMKG